MAKQGFAFILVLSLFALASLSACAPRDQAVRTPQSVPEERTARPPEAADAVTTQPTTTALSPAPTLANPGPGDTQAGPADTSMATILLISEVHGKTDPCG